MKKIVFLLAVLLILNGCAPSQTSPNWNSSQARLAPSGFDGTWTGESERITGPHLEKNSKFGSGSKFKIEIIAGKAWVYGWKSNQWVKFWRKLDTSFHAAIHDTNAVIFQIVRDSDGDCIWTESWTLNLTKTGSDTALAYFYRTVNNRDCKEEEDNNWTIAGSISLKKIAE
jgi:hypothetical protein